VRVLVLVHHRNAAAGVFADPARAAGHELVEWLPHEGPPPTVDGFGAAIVLGGEAQVDQEDAHPWLRPEKRLLRELLERDTPLLGVCLGSQLVAEVTGAEVGPMERPEIGWREVELTPEGSDDPVLGFLPDRLETFQWHHYEWLLPPGAVALARSAACLQAFRLERRPVWGVQFHPEVTGADLGSWLDTWHDDPGAVATGLDPDAIRADSAARIGAWNEVGHGIAERFLAAAAASPEASGTRR
jgi:GMP synthase-like glutamine amidotransferase